jgi:hypothetical protein
MDRETLIQKLKGILDEWERTRSWGNVEIEVREGVPNMMRITKNEKLEAQENIRGRHDYRR